MVRRSIWHNRNTHQIHAMEYWYSNLGPSPDSSRHRRIQPETRQPWNRPVKHFAADLGRTRQQSFYLSRQIFKPKPEPLISIMDSMDQHQRGNSTQPVRPDNQY